MTELIRYRTMQPGEERAVSRLVARVFHHHVAPLLSERGIQEFLKYIDPGAIQARLERNYFLQVATVEAQLIGAIAVRDHEHVSLLFVETAFQRQGIAGQLLERAVGTCRAHRPDVRRLDVNASPNAIRAYEKMGFRQLREEQIENGIRFVPMAMDLPECDGVLVEGGSR